MRSGLRRIIQGRRRNHGQSDDHHRVAGARLARLTFAPDIVLSDGEAQLLADTPAIGTAGAVEGWMPFGRVFETLAWGRRHVVMGANQIDRFGNQNLSAFGPLQHPTRQMFGVRGAPGNTVNHATSYWVGNHSQKRVFCNEVDVVSGIGWDKVDPGNPAFRFVNIYRVVSNLGVFDFGGPDHTMRALFTPSRRRTRRGARQHVLRGPRTRRRRPDPTRHRRGIRNLIRERIDPKALRDRSQTVRLKTRLTELAGIEHPVVQTGMGWVAGARLVSATSNAGGLGILASATMTIDELAVAITKVKASTDRPFGVNIRADAADAADRVELMIREGVVASFALAPKPELIS